MSKPLEPNNRALLKRVDKARRFPTNTCPASRHAATIGEALMRGKPYPMLTEEPENCAGSILATVAALWELRTSAGDTSLSQRIDELVAQHGSLRKAAKVLEVDVGYLSRLRKNPDANPGRMLLRKMGLQEVIGYQRRAAGGGN